jgi:hypothetical protein
MVAVKELRGAIAQALSQFTAGDFANNALKLFARWLYRLNYADPILKCQHIRQRSRKFSKFLNPYPDRLINFNLLLIPSTTPLVVRL